MKLRVLLADDHTLLRQALRMTLEMDPDIEVTAEAQDGQGALAGVARTNPDVVCMDINMPGMNGIEATRLILASHPKVKVIGLSGHDDPVLTAEMFAAGARAYVVKNGSGVELLRTIRSVCTEQNPASPALPPDPGQT